MESAASGRAGNTRRLGQRPRSPPCSGCRAASAAPTHQEDGWRGRPGPSSSSGTSCSQSLPSPAPRQSTCMGHREPVGAEAARTWGPKVPETVQQRSPQSRCLRRACIVAAVRGAGVCHLAGGNGAHLRRWNIPGLVLRRHGKGHQTRGPLKKLLTSQHPPPVGGISTLSPRGCRALLPRKGQGRRSTRLLMGWGFVQPQYQELISFSVANCKWRHPDMQREALG